MTQRGQVLELQGAGALAEEQCGHTGTESAGATRGGCMRGGFDSEQAAARRSRVRSNGAGA